MPRGLDGTVLIEFDVNKYVGDGYGQYMEYLDYHIHGELQMVAIL